MPRSRAPKHMQTDFDLGHNRQRDTRSARGYPPHASGSKLSHTPIDAHREREEESLIRDQFQADWKLRKEGRKSNGFLSNASASNLEPRNRFSHPISSPRTRPYQDAEFINTADNGWSRVTSLSYDPQLYQRYPSHPPSPTPSPNRKTQQRGSLQGVYEDKLESVYHPSPPSPTSTERFARDRSDWSSASIQPRDPSNTPINHPRTGSPPDRLTHQVRGLTRRPRVQNPNKRVSRGLGDGLRRSVDPETPQVTEMGYSVMSVRRSNPDGSGYSSSSRFSHPPTTGRPIPVARSDGGAGPLGISPSSHVDSETRQPVSRIKVREEAGSAFSNTHSIPKKELHALDTPSLMNHMEEEWPSISPVSTPKAPPLDQHPVIREDLQQEAERPIAGCLADPQISFHETAAVEDRKSLGSARSTSPSLGVSHLQSHAVPANKGDGRNLPGHHVLFQELYQMLESVAHPGSDALRMEIRRDGKSEEGAIRPGYDFEEGSNPSTPRGNRGPVQTLHLDILLAQRVVRDAMQEDAERVGFSDRSCMVSAASEYGEEVEGPSSGWSECELARKHSTRSVFDWGYA